MFHYYFIIKLCIIVVYTFYLVIFLIVAKKYQNKGYGSIIFSLLLSKINDSVRCLVPFENIKMQRIIQKNNGIEIGRNGQIIQYIIRK